MMLQSTEQRAIAWTSIGLAAAVLLGWLVLFFGGEYLVGLIESGRGPLGHIKSLATRLLADVPNDQFAAALLGEFYKFAGRVTTIYVACQAFVLIAKFNGWVLSEKNSRTICGLRAEAISTKAWQAT